MNSNPYYSIRKSYLNASNEVHELAGVMVGGNFA